MKRVIKIPKEGDLFTNLQGDTAEVVSYKNAHEVFVKFYGRKSVCKFSSGNLKCGRFKDPEKPFVCGVGYLGLGNFYAKFNGEHDPAYKCWSSMLKRCYNLDDSHYSSYGGKGVYVEKEWHNYQNFATWYHSKLEALVLGKYEIDKDLKGKGYYAPESCTLVPRFLNTFARTLGEGKEVNKKHKKYSTRIGIFNKRFDLQGSYDKEETSKRRMYLIFKILENLLSVCKTFGVVEKNITASLDCPNLSTETALYLDKVLRDKILPHIKEKLPLKLKPYHISDYSVKLKEV